MPLSSRTRRSVGPSLRKIIWAPASLQVRRGFHLPHLRLHSISTSHLSSPSTFSLNLHSIPYRLPKVHVHPINATSIRHFVLAQVQDNLKLNIVKRWYLQIHKYILILSQHCLPMYLVLPLCSRRRPVASLGGFASVVSLPTLPMYISRPNANIYTVGTKYIVDTGKLYHLSNPLNDVKADLSSILCHSHRRRCIRRSLFSTPSGIKQKSSNQEDSTIWSCYVCSTYSERD